VLRRLAVAPPLGALSELSPARCLRLRDGFRFLRSLTTPELWVLRLYSFLPDASGAMGAFAEGHDIWWTQ